MIKKVFGRKHNKRTKTG